VDVVALDGYNWGMSAAWNTDLGSYFSAQPDVMGFVWFHFQKEADLLAH